MSGPKLDVEEVGTAALQTASVVKLAFVDAEFTN